jgi:hypothetical protein
LLSTGSAWVDEITSNVARSQLLRLTTRISTALCAAILAACSASGPPAISLDLATPHQPAVVITGLSRRDLASLDSAKLSPPGWTAVFRVSVVPDDGYPNYVAIAGQYTITSGAVRFTPMYPLDAGRRYRVAFNPAAAPGGALAKLPELSRVVQMPAATPAERTRVSAIYPTGPAVPANLLRMYVEFSDPMGTRTGQDYIRILDAAGAEMPGALLPLDTDLWNGGHTRFTILFDPGRVKRGILPNRAMGRPLKDGGGFTIVVHQEWPDAQSLALASDFRKTYQVGPAVEAPLSTDQWRLSAPAAGSREPLRVTFPAPLDHGLLQRTLTVNRDNAAVAGEISIANGETEWRFTPRDAWRPGSYAVSVLPVLEDPSGNRIGHAFETVSPDDDTQAPPVRLPFTIR